MHKGHGEHVNPHILGDSTHSVPFGHEFVLQKDTRVAQFGTVYEHGHEHVYVPHV